MKYIKYIILLILASTWNVLISQCPTFDEAAKKILIAPDKYVDPDCSRDCSSCRDTFSLAYHKQGVNFYRKKTIDSALLYMANAVSLRESQYGGSPNTNLVQSSYNAGFFAQKLDREEDAISFFLKCINYGKEINEDLRARSWIGIGQVYQKKGAYYDAKRAFYEALNISKSTSNKARYCQTIVDLSKLMFDREEFGGTINLIISNIDSFSISDNPVNYAKINQNLGVSYLRDRQFNKGIHHLQNAIAIYNEMGSKEKVIEMHNNISRAYQMTNDFPKSKYHLDQARKSLTKQDEDWLKAQYYDHLGEYYYEQNLIEKSLAEYQRAIATMLFSFHPLSNDDVPSENDIIQAKDPMRVAIYIKDKAKAHSQNYFNKKDQNELDIALRLFELGDKAIDVVRSRQSSSASHLLWRSKAMEYYEAALHLCSQINEADRAFYFMEKSRGVMLYEALLLSRVLNEHDSPLINRYINLRDSLNTMSTVNVDREDMHLRIRKLEEELKSSCVDCFNARFSDSVPELSSYKQEMKDGSVGLYYYMGPDNTFLLAAGKNYAEIRNLGNSQNIEELINNYVKGISNKSNTSDTSFLLGDILIPESIQNEFENVIIYPSGNLFKVPFEALNFNNEIGESVYLGDKYNISYDYSYRINDLREESSTRKKILALAPFPDEIDENWIPSSQEELGILKSMYVGNYYSGKNATYQSIQNDLNDYSVVHLSTHAFSSDTSSAFIMLRDTNWYIDDIYNTKTNANLIVLSACQTNKGSINNSEGVLSIGRAFNYAGASSMISSLWSVNSNSTADILKRFYIYLSKGTPKYQALSYAKRDYCKDPNIPLYEKSPYYWAGLVYYGDDGSVSISNKTSVTWMYMLLLIFLLAVFLKNKG